MVYIHERAHGWQWLCVLPRNQTCGYKASTVHTQGKLTSEKQDWQVTSWPAKTKKGGKWILIHAYLDQQKNNLHNCVKVSYKCFAYIIFRTSALSNPTSHSFATSSYHFWIIRKKAVDLSICKFPNRLKFQQGLSTPGSNSKINLAWKRIPEARTRAPVVLFPIL